MSTGPTWRGGVALPADWLRPRDVSDARTHLDFRALMALEPHGPDTFVGISEPVPFPRVYGGQVAAQGLRAATATVDDHYAVHSLHAYFIRPGVLDEPIRFEVDRTRNGRSFVTRNVVARQSAGAIFSMSASFQVAEAEAEVVPHRPPGGVPGPEDLTSQNWGAVLDRRPVPVGPELPSTTLTWLRVRTDLGLDPVLQACALAYCSDDMPTAAAILDHPAADHAMAADEDWERFMAATLDHAIWFHRPVRADQWHLHALQGQGLTGGRGLALGRVYDRDGLHVATVAQEVVVREARR